MLGWLAYKQMAIIIVMAKVTVSRFKNAAK